MRRLIYKNRYLDSTVKRKIFRLLEIKISMIITMAILAANLSSTKIKFLLKKKVLE